MKLSNSSFKKLLIGVSIVLSAITAHVTYKEVTVTNTGIPNKPNQEQLTNIKYVCDSVFEKARNHFKVPIYISSGIRVIAVNQAVHGVENSQHVKGEALDLDCDVYGKITNKQLFNYIHDSLDYDQLITEGGKNGWIHVSYVIKNNRHESFNINNP